MPPGATESSWGTRLGSFLKRLSAALWKGAGILSKGFWKLKTSRNFKTSVLCQNVRESERAEIYASSK